MEEGRDELIKQLIKELDEERIEILLEYLENMLFKE